MGEATGVEAVAQPQDAADAPKRRPLVDPHLVETAAGLGQRRERPGGQQDDMAAKVMRPNCRERPGGEDEVAKRAMLDDQNAVGHRPSTSA